MAAIDWKIMKLRRKLRRRKERKVLETAKAILKKGTLVMFLIGAAVIFTGAYTGTQRLVEDEYTVQENDTLWNISEAYMEKNTGGRRYILEFIEGIKELNPWILEIKGQIHPGDRLRINYWVKE